MAVLTESGPLRFHDLYDAINARFPDVVPSKHHLKVHILQSALVHRLMKVKLDDSLHKDGWALRRPGQIRMRIARGRRTRPATTSAGSASIRKLTRRGKANWKPNERGPGPDARKKKRVKWQ